MKTKKERKKIRIITSNMGDISERFAAKMFGAKTFQALNTLADNGHYPEISSDGVTIRVTDIEEGE